MSAEFAQASKADVLRAYGKLPLCFGPNQSQADPRVKYLSHSQGYTVCLTSNEAVMVFRKAADQAILHENPSGTRSEGSNPAFAGFKLGSRNEKAAVLRMWQGSRAGGLAK